MFTFSIQKNKFKIIPTNGEKQTYDYYDNGKLLFKLKESITQKNTEKNIKLLDEISKCEHYTINSTGIELVYNNKKNYIHLSTLLEENKINFFKDKIICQNCKRAI